MKEFEFFLEKTQEIGYVESFEECLALISGLPFASFQELIISESGKKGIVVGIKENFVEALMFDKEIKVGEKVTRTGEEVKIGVCENLKGRILDPLLRPLDGLGIVKGEKKYLPLMREAPSILEREQIKEPLETGVLLVDLLVPLAQGQRELVLGDPKTGKTTFLLQTICHQTKKGTICIYAGIGKKDISIRWVEDYLKTQGVFEKIILIHCPPDLSPTLIYLSPFSAITIAEFFREKGENVLVVLDDLTTHAKVWRQISLLRKVTPGRENYPGDIFHLHAALLERAGKTKKGAISILGVVETLENDISGFIQTNLISITDGHLFFDIEEYKKGKRPAINPFLSVTRVGNQTRTLAEKEIGDWIRKNLIQYQRVKEMSQFGAELTREVSFVIELGQKIEVFLQQEEKKILERELQLVLAGLLICGFWEKKSVLRMKEEIDSLVEIYQKFKLPKLREKPENIKNLEHLRFLIKEIIPLVEKLLKQI